MSIVDPEMPAPFDSAKVEVGIEDPARAAQLMVPEKLELTIVLQEIPSSLSSVLEKLLIPDRRFSLKSFIKDYIPALTPIALALFTFIASVYTIKFGNQLLTETFDKITTEFLQGKEDPNVAAMKLATYGKKALPAVRLVLSAQNKDLRNGGELVLEQMYVEETVDRKTLIDTLLRDYGNPMLRLGVLEWLVKMDKLLPEEDASRFLTLLTKSFGEQAKNCEREGDSIALEAAHFLNIWHISSSKELVLGLAENCPAQFEGVREQALIALPSVVSKQDKADVLEHLEQMNRKAPAGLDPIIENAIKIIKAGK